MDFCYQRSEWERNCWNILGKRIPKNKSKRIQNRKSNEKKCDEFYVKWTGYNNLCNSWIDKKKSQYK